MNFFEIIFYRILSELDEKWTNYGNVSFPPFKKVQLLQRVLSQNSHLLSDIMRHFTVPYSPQIRQHMCEIRLETHFCPYVQYDSHWTVIKGIHACFATFCLHFTRTGWVVWSLRRGHRRTLSPLKVFPFLFRDERLRKLKFALMFLAVNKSFFLNII